MMQNPAPDHCGSDLTGPRPVSDLGRGSGMPRASLLLVSPGSGALSLAAPRPGVGPDTEVLTPEN